jgi:hypothetical protein
MSKSVEQQLDLLLDLVNKQDEALKTADEIILLKNKLISICEQETTMYKKACRNLMVIGVLLMVISLCMFLIK